MTCSSPSWSVDSEMLCNPVSEQWTDLTADPSGPAASCREGEQDVEFMQNRISS